MEETPDIVTFTAAPTNFTNGASTDYTITLNSPIPLLSTDKLIFTFPTEITPTGSSCTSLTTGVTVACTGTTTMTAVFTITSGTEYAENTDLQFTIAAVTNPASTKETSEFTSVTLKDTADG